MTRFVPPLVCWMLLSVGLVARSEQPADSKPLHWVSWQQRHATGELLSGEIVPVQDGESAHLRLVHEASEPRLFPLVVIESPPITSESYVLRGRIRYEGVEGDSYLEMWSHFPSKGAFFSRTLADGGPLGKIHGTSGWRLFELPFQMGDEHPPEKLVVNLQLQGRGTVAITDLELHAPARGYGHVPVAGAWWSDATGGIVGGLIGAFLGVFLGGVVAPLAAMGRAKWFAMGSLIACGVVSIGLLIAGMVAVVLGQPYGVYYPLLLSGGLGAFFGIGGLPLARRRYRDAELRRMTALDVA